MKSGGEGFVGVNEIMGFGQSLGFVPSQVEFALRHGVDKRLLQSGPRQSDEAARRYRISSVGAYTYKKLLPAFISIDAVVLDTPIVSKMPRRRLPIPVKSRIASCARSTSSTILMSAGRNWREGSWRSIGGRLAPGCALILGAWNAVLGGRRVQEGRHGGDHHAGAGGTATCSACRTRIRAPRLLLI